VAKTGNMGGKGKKHTIAGEVCPYRIYDTGFFKRICAHQPSIDIRHSL
jgi:hypothetical protein